MRGKPAPKRSIIPDPKYGSERIAKFTNAIMERGKKSVARSIVYDAFDVIEKKSKRKAVEVFDEAMKNVMPVVEVRSRRIGGANYQIPIEVRGERKQALAFRWMIEACNKRKGRPMYEKLAQEIMDAAKGEGESIKKREDVHRMAEANRAFAHFA
jgi:small subunit ribosomal protein S7